MKANQHLERVMTNIKHPLLCTHYLPRRCSTNALKGFWQCRVPALIAVLFATVVMALPRQANGQQETNPTWYDPWAPPNTVVHSVQPRRDRPQHERNVSASSSHHTARLRGKGAAPQIKSSYKRPWEHGLGFTEIGSSNLSD